MTQNLTLTNNVIHLLEDAGGKVFYVGGWVGTFLKNILFNINGSMARKVTLEEFVEKANIVHNNKYSYEKVIYTGSKGKVIVTCSIHGDFSVEASNHTYIHKHFKAKGCPQCGKQMVRDRNKAGQLSIEVFEQRASAIHSNKYEYSSDFNGIRSKIEIKCSKHGIFKQIAGQHLRGTGCPKCKNSHGQAFIEENLRILKVDYVNEHTFEKCLSPLSKKLKFDFYLPKFNMCIEYDGEQHFKPVRFHQNMSQEVANKMFERTKLYDKIKNDYCQANQIKLIRIPYSKKGKIGEILKTLL